jgi:tRNA nucleotidyltransferase/poly(A) polymerase
MTTFRKDIGSINHRKPAEVVFTDSLEEDALRRDFTCNAIYFDPKTQTCIDPTGGSLDIEK